MNLNYNPWKIKFLSSSSSSLFGAWGGGRRGGGMFFSLFSTQLCPVAVKTQEQGTV